MPHETSRQFCSKCLSLLVLLTLSLAGSGSALGQERRRLARLPKLVEGGTPRPRLGITHGGDPRSVVGGPFPYPAGFDGRALLLQTKAEAAAKSEGLEI